MKVLVSAVMVLFLVLAAFSPVAAHFQVLKPSNDMVQQQDEKKVTLDIMFTHPMEGGPIMEMGNPNQFGVFIHGEKIDLLSSLKEKKIDEKKTFTAFYEIKSPGDHIFFIEPTPYWEPAEEKMIVHYTKVIVNGYGEEEGWDALVGFPVEIEPLVRPYGLWKGNVFRGIVKRQGVPVAFAEIEVEYLNENKDVKIPADPFITQVIKADSNGVFCYALPKSGWWSFAALCIGEEKMKSPQGAEVEVELGALIWIKCIDME